nr:uncharacterized protein LOC127313844 isoform X2 [Lolium perenne]
MASPELCFECARRKSKSSISRCTTAAVFPCIVAMVTPHAAARFPGSAWYLHGRQTAPRSGQLPSRSLRSQIRLGKHQHGGVELLRSRPISPRPAHPQCQCLAAGQPRALLPPPESGVDDEAAQSATGWCPCCVAASSVHLCGDRGPKQKYQCLLLI